MRRIAAACSRQRGGKPWRNTAGRRARPWRRPDGALRGIFGEQALGVIDAHVGEQIDVRHAERLFQHGAEIGSRDADGVRSGGLRVLKVVVGAGIEHGVDDDGVPCLHFAGGAGHAAFERLPDGIVIGGKRDAVRRGADDAVRGELLKDVVQLGLAHAAEIKGKEQPCRAGGEEGLELPVGDRRLENKDRQIIVDPLRPGEQQREARGRERAAALQIGQQIVRHLVRAGYGQPDGRAGVRHGNRVAECVLHALRGEIVPVKPGWRRCRDTARAGRRSLRAE